jgi:hypothetical protein
VLKRLLALNAERAAAERRAGLTLAAEPTADDEGEADFELLPGDEEEDGA